VVDGTTELEETTGRVIIPEDTPYTITFNLGTPVTTPYEDFDDDEELTQDLTYDNNTYIVNYTYTDTNDSAAGARLLVYEESYSSGDTLICNESSALSSASLTCNMSGYSGNFIATAYIDRGTEVVTDIIRFAVDLGRDIFGKTGMIAGWFLILTAAMAFLLHPIIGVIAILLTMIFVNLIGLIHFGGTFLFGMIFVGILIVWLMRD
jgi:hypothetical protein